MKKRVSIFLFLFLFFLAIFFIFKQARINVNDKAWLKDLKSVENFALLDHRGKPFELFRKKNSKLVLLISQGNGCPILQKQMPVLNTLKERFKSNDLKVYFINSNSQDSIQDIKLEVSKLKSNIHVLLDKTQHIGRTLEFERTAKALLIETDTWKIIYSGAISDQFSYDSDKGTGSKKYLEDAINQYLAGNEVTVKTKDALGCLINYDTIHKNVLFKDIEKTLINKCLNCHNSNGYYPQNMLTIQDWVGWSKMVREQIRTKKMPPWPLDNDLLKVKNSNSLSFEEEQKIMTWLEKEDHSLENLNYKIKLKTSKGNTKQDNTKIIFRAEEDLKIPAKRENKYYYRKISNVLNEDVWVTSLKVNINQPAAVHHVDMYILPEKITDYQNTVLHNLIRTLWPKAGFRAIALKTKGLNPIMNLQKNTALRFPKGSYLVLEIHTAQTGKEENIKVNLEVTPLEKSQVKSHKEIHIGIINAAGFKVGAGAKGLAIEESAVVQRSVLIYGVQMHMHRRGRQMVLYHIDNQEKSTKIISAPFYNPLRQGSWSFLQPLQVKKGDKLRVECLYDNSSTNPFNPNSQVEVLHGLTFENHEMCKLEYQFSYI